VVRAVGVDPESGALTVSDGETKRSVVTGEIRHVRLDGAV
jgi:hypothetical protein